MRGLPVGVPKLIVSTLASGDTRPYMGATDVSMTYSVVDISGLNRISERILSNAAGAIAGMAKVLVADGGEGRPLIGASMFGVTTPAVTRARERLEELGYEVLVFHATGAGGQSLEALIRDGFLVGVLDVFFGVAHQSYLPTLVERGQLLEGNSKLAVSRSTANIAGLGVAGVVIQAITAPLAIVLDAISYLISALCVLLIRRREEPPAPLRPHAGRPPADRPDRAFGQQERRAAGAVGRAVDPDHDDVVHPDRRRAVAAAHRARHRDRAAELGDHRAGDVPDRVRDGPGAAEILR